MAGRPKAEIDLEQLQALCRLKPSLADCAAFFKVSERTIERFIREQCDLDFVEFREQNLVHTRHALIRKALQMALKTGNPAMLIFCLKNMCNWTDKQEISANGNNKVAMLAYPIE